MCSSTAAHILSIRTKLKLVFQRTTQHLSIQSARRRLVAAFHISAIAFQIARADKVTAAKVEALVLVVQTQREPRVHELGAERVELPFGALREQRWVGFGSRSGRARRNLLARFGIGIAVHRHGAGAIGVATDNARRSTTGAVKVVDGTGAQCENGAIIDGSPSGAFAFHLTLLAGSKGNAEVVVATKDAASATIGTGKLADCGVGAIDVVVLQRGADLGIIVGVERVHLGLRRCGKQA